MKVKRIAAGEVVRCMGWSACCEKHCRHYNPHEASFERGCTHQRQVQYCEIVRHFVTDVLLTDIDSNLKSNPNMAFKHRKAVRRAEWNS